MPQETTNASLSPGTLIGRYEIREVLGIGGFGITYKAWDSKLNRLVAIKEYLPADTAVRLQGSSQINAYESRTDEYQYGLERFLEEAKILAKFIHPNIVGVLDHLELNNTAYLIMVYEQGQTLSQQLKQQGNTLPELELKRLIKAVLTGLQHIHEHDYYHRDIKPGNIYIRKQGEPVLIDFGAARQAIGTRSRSLTSIVSAGYAPSEQYGSNQSKQGPWSDLYSVGAMMYRCISGETPTDAPTRQNALFEQDPDPLVPAIKRGQDRYTEDLLQLIDWLLQPAIKNRPQNVTQVLARLESTVNSHDPLTTAPTVAPEEVRTTAPTKIVKHPEADKPSQESPITNDQVSNIQTAEAKRQTKNPKHWISLISIILLLALGFNQKQRLLQWLDDTTIKPEQTTLQPQSQSAIVENQQARLAEQEEQLQIRRQQRTQVQKQQQKTLENQTQQKIQMLLAQASEDINRLRLSSPIGNNAVEKYQQILQLDSDNPAAQQGLTQVTEKYLALAATSLKQQTFKKARQYLKKASVIQPGNTQISKVEQQLQLAENNYQEQQARLAAQRITIGSTGPGGGIVFYVDSTGKHGLEAKRADEGGGTRFKWDKAKTVAKSSGSGWHLPTKRELNLLYKQKNVVGGFAYYYYWSSTESGSGDAWLQLFDYGNQGGVNDYDKGDTNRVRAVRAF